MTDIQDDRGQVCELTQKYNQYFVVTANCIDLFSDIIQAIECKKLSQKDWGEFRLILLFNYIKATNSLKTLRLVASRCLTEDGRTTVRKLIELALNMIYLSDDPDSRASLYWHHGHVTMYFRAKRYVNDISQSSLLRDGFGQMLPEIERHFEEAKKIIPCTQKGELKREYRFNWSGLSVSNLAKACGLSQLYDRYDQFSTSVHPSPEDLTTYFKPDTGEFDRGMDDEEVPALLCLGAELHLILSALTVRVFDLNHHSTIHSMFRRIAELDSEASSWLKQMIIDCDGNYIPER